MSSLLRSAAARRARARAEPPWGLQAVAQFSFVCILATLLYDALVEVSTSTDRPEAVLLQLDSLLRDGIRRINLALAGDAELRPSEIGPNVGVWSLTALIANLLSASLLVVLCLFGWAHERAKLRILIALLAFLASVLTLLTAPLLYASAYRANGALVPIDAAMASLLIYVCCLFADVAGARDYPAGSSERASYFAFIFAVDIPCIGVTALFTACAFYVPFPPAFVVGTVAALFAYYTLAFLLLAGFNWTNTSGGKTMMTRLSDKRVWGVIAAGAALNGTLGSIAQYTKVPIYLDLVGSFIVGALCGPFFAAVSAALGVAILGVTTTPIALAYMGTAIVVAALAAKLINLGFMSSWPRTALIALIVLGPVSTALSVPVTVYLFGGVTFAGTDAVTLFFTRTGDSLLEAVAKGAIVFDAIDKCASALIAYALLRRIPEQLSADLRR